MKKMLLLSVVSCQLLVVGASRAEQLCMMGSIDHSLWTVEFGNQGMGSITNMSGTWSVKNEYQGITHTLVGRHVCSSNTNLIGYTDEVVTDGPACHCQRISANGISKNGAWFLMNVFSTAALCSVNCAMNCANLVKGAKTPRAHALAPAI